MDRSEVRHFVEEQIRNDYGIKKLLDENFDEWFR
jgi:hypothetical protein